MLYPKIETLYERDKETFKVDPDRVCLLEVDLIKQWLVTEKIDGTNIRVVIRPGGVSVGMVAAGDIIATTVEFRGRTDRAQVPPFLLTRLEEMITPLLCDIAFPDLSIEEVILYGEGYGARIQKGGGNYREGVSFRLFDVAVDTRGEGNYLWLDWENVEDIAQKLGIETVPVLCISANLAAAVSCVSSFSAVAKQDGGNPATICEGIVARTEPLLCDRRGRRLMWKLKGKDFATNA